MLCDKDGVPLHRRLLAVVWDNGGRETCAYKVCGVRAKSSKPDFLDVFDVFIIEMKARAKGGSREFFKCLFRFHFKGLSRDFTTD